MSVHPKERLIIALPSWSNEPVTSKHTTLLHATSSSQYSIKISNTSTWTFFICSDQHVAAFNMSVMCVVRGPANSGMPPSVYSAEFGPKNIDQQFRSLQMFNHVTGWLGCLIAS
jgi:hypothetical protein